jgi:hypothetical protein
VQGKKDIKGHNLCLVLLKTMRYINGRKMKKNVQSIT